MVDHHNSQWKFWNTVPVCSYTEMHWGRQIKLKDGIDLLDPQGHFSQG